MSRKLRIGVNLRIGNLPVFDGNSAVMRSIARALSVSSSGHQIDLIVDAPPALKLPAEGNADFHIIRPFPSTGSCAGLSAGTPGTVCDYLWTDAGGIWTPTSATPTKNRP